jgi:hypothetical protein
MTRAALGVAAAALALAPGAAASSSGPRCVPAQLNASAVLPGTGIAASPLPGSYDASPRTQISLLGAAPASLGPLRVTGSRSGAHAGRLHPYSEGDGASFVLATPLRAGETVSVGGSVRLAGGGVRRFAYRFTVAHEDVLPYVRSVHAIRDPNEKQHFHSEPTLQPPALLVTARSTEASPGYLFASPYSGPGPSGPMIFDEAGDLVWFDPLPAGTEGANLQVQQLEGRPVLTWWQGYIPPQGFGQGEEVILDGSYRLLERVHAGNGFSADLHDFEITPQGTALVTVFDPLYCDLSSHGGPRAGAVTDTLFQEIDLRTGLVRREWHSLDHVPLGDSYGSAFGASSAWPFDYFHLNSLEELSSGTTLISARNTWAVYELSTLTGQVLTSIGGRHSSVKLVPGAATAYQHDASRLPDGTIAIFDNGALPKIHSQSRGVLLDVDPVTGTASVRAQYVHPTPLSSGSQGNLQILENGDVFIGWGSAPYFSEFSPGGRLLFDAHMRGSYQSYRTYRFPWTGAPATAPAIAVSGAAGQPVTVYASWNGDTRTASWQLLAGPSAGQLVPVASAPRSGFETAIAVPAGQAFVAVRALDASGAVLGSSAAVRG